MGRNIYPLARAAVAFRNAVVVVVLVQRVEVLEPERHLHLTAVAASGVGLAIGRALGRLHAIIHGLLVRRIQCQAIVASAAGQLCISSPMLASKGGEGGHTNASRSSGGQAGLGWRGSRLCQFWSHVDGGWEGAAHVDSVVFARRLVRAPPHKGGTTNGAELRSGYYMRRLLLPRRPTL